jgi:beta-N-acetylhexosaminidase
MSELIIRPYDNALDSASVSTLWQETFPPYPISPQHLESLLTLPLGTHFVALLENQLIGFCATYREPSQGETGYLAIIAIHSEFQSKGHGTKLLEHAMEHLWKSFKKIKVGSSIPRFWPGVPTDLSIKDQEFFVKRGELTITTWLLIIHLSDVDTRL